MRARGEGVGVRVGWGGGESGVEVSEVGVRVGWGREWGGVRVGWGSEWGVMSLCAHWSERRSLGVSYLAWCLECHTWHISPDTHSPTDITTHNAKDTTADHETRGCVDVEANPCSSKDHFNINDIFGGSYTIITACSMTSSCSSPHPHSVFTRWQHVQPQPGTAESPQSTSCN